MTTAFIETPRFPEDISYGSSGGPGFNTDLVVSASGWESANENWSQSRCEFDVSHGLKNQAQLDNLISFFRVCSGRAGRFRYKDWLDYQVTTSNGRIGSGIGDGTPGPHQLRKRYTAGATTTDRDIRKPTATPAAALYRAAVLKTLTTHYTLDTTTGLVTWVADATANASVITVGTTTQVTLASNPGTLIAGQKLYLTGFTGTDAALVNNLAHTINSVSGAGPYVFTLATNTSGNITVGSGQGKKYPQASEALTWSGEFDVPCRFDTDQMRVTLAFYSGFEWGQIPIVEVRV